MPKATTPSFITEIPLHTSSKEQAVLRKRFWAAKQQYNALLGEALKRLRNMRADKRYQEARELYKQKGKKTEGKVLFKKLAEEYGHRQYNLQAFCKQWNTKNNPLSIGAALSQKIAERVFKAIEEYRVGKRGKPRFKGYRGLSSIEDKQPTTLRIKEDNLRYLGLSMPLQYNLRDPIHYHGLNSRIKYIRLIKRKYNGRIRYTAQLINEGQPWVKSKNQSGKATVGLDIGPQTIAIVSPEKEQAQLRVFADEIKPLKQAKKATSAKNIPSTQSQQPHLLPSRQMGEERQTMATKTRQVHQRETPKK